MMLLDPTFTIQPDNPGSFARVESGLTSEEKYRIAFRGQVYECWPIVDVSYAIGDRVRFIQIGNAVGFSPVEDGFPTRWRRPLSDWAPSHSANLALRYVLRNNPRHFTYSRGTISELIDGKTVRVTKNGLKNVLRAEFPSNRFSAIDFYVGDSCLIYSQVPGREVVIGWFDQPPRRSNDPTFIPDGPIYETQFGYSQYTRTTIEIGRSRVAWDDYYMLSPLMRVTIHYPPAGVCVADIRNYHFIIGNSEDVTQSIELIDITGDHWDTSGSWVRFWLNFHYKDTRNNNIYIFRYLIIKSLSGSTVTVYPPTYIGTY